MPFKVFSVQSSHIMRVGYDSDKQLLKIVFRNGGTYHYSNVPDSIFNEIRMAPSVGKYFHQTIKKGNYPFEKVIE
jgi:hypothetical protein